MLPWLWTASWSTQNKLADIWWQINKHWWSGQAKTIDCENWPHAMLRWLMKQASVEERFVICRLLLVAWNKLGIEMWQRNTAALKLFVLSAALITNSKIVPPKTILRNIWWQTNKHWWSGQAGTKNCHDHVRQEGAPQINLAWICWQKLNLWCVAAIETKSGVADLLPVNLFCFGPGYE